MALLAESDEPVAQQHLAILQLITTGIPVESVFQIVTDSSSATDEALAAIEKADLQRLHRVVMANPSAAQVPGSGPLLLAVMALASDQPDAALQAVEEAAATSSETQRRAHIIRLRRLAATVGEDPRWDPRALDRLIAVLQPPPSREAVLE
jgi:hypothetical protein